MKRITERTKHIAIRIYDYVKEKKDGFYPIEEQCALNKLGALEDVEEELGIDLAKLFKALKDGIWVKFAGEKPYHVKAPISLRGPDKTSEVFHFTLRYPVSYSTIQELHLKDYGKTWALTKEELE